MGRASAIQHAFNAGEFSPLMYGRQDVEKYKSALATCYNALPLVQGAWTRRPGMAFLHQARHHDKACRLYPFKYSVTQVYILEFGEYYIRFYTNHGLLTQTAQNILGVTQANPAVLNYDGADSFANGDRVYVASAQGMTQINNREFVVANVNAAANTFELKDSDGNNVNSTGYGAYTTGGTVAKIFEVTTTFTEAEVPNIRVVQSADTLYILHADHAPQTLVRNSATSWTLSTISFTDGPYDVANTTSTTLTPSAATGAGVTLTASAVTGINNGAGFASTDVGRLIRIKEGSVWGYVQITGWTSTTVVTVTVLSTLTNTTAKSTWRMGVWSATTGYPTCGTFHDDRLWLGGAALYPQRIDGSKTSVYTSYAPSATDGTVASDNAVAFTMNSDDVNAVKWMYSDEKGLLVGTASAEWVVRPSSLTEALTPTNISAKPSTHRGSATVPAVRASKAIVFVERAGRKVREMAYVFEVDGFRSPDMTLMAEHITRPAVSWLTYQSQPQQIVWAVRSDGVLLGLTYERDQEVVGWHSHELGGYSNAGHTVSALVESACAVPDPSAVRDEMYAVVKRYVNGGTKRYIEYMSKLWESGDAQEDAFYVDSGWTVVNASPSLTVTGLWHLEGETVGVYVDGTRHTDVTITNGTATLSRTGTIVTLGYFYNSNGLSLPLEAGAQDGTAQAKLKRIPRIGFWLMDTLGLKFGPDSSSLSELLSRQWGDPYGSATGLFTGVVRERFEGDHDRLGQVYWRADGPFPANVLAVMPQVNVSDDS